MSFFFGPESSSGTYTRKASVTEKMDTKVSVFGNSISQRNSQNHGDINLRVFFLAKTYRHWKTEHALGGFSHHRHGNLKNKTRLLRR